MSSPVQTPLDPSEYQFAPPQKPPVALDESEYQFAPTSPQAKQGEVSAPESARPHPAPPTGSPEWFKAAAKVNPVGAANMAKYPEFHDETPELPADTFDPEGGLYRPPPLSPKMQALEDQISFTPHVAMPALTTVKKYAVDPLDKASEFGARHGKRIALGIASDTGPFLDPNTGLPRSPTQEEQQASVERFQREHPRASGIVGAIGSTAGGMIADPRVWPFFFASPGVGGAKGFLSRAASPALQKAATVGFAAQMGAGTIQQAAVVSEIWNRQDVPLEQKYETITDLVLSAMMTGMVAKHAAGKGEPEAPQLDAQLAEQLNALGEDAKKQIFQRIQQKVAETKPAEAQTVQPLDPSEFQFAKPQEAQKSAGPATEMQVPQQSAAQPEVAFPKQPRYKLPEGVVAAKVEGPVKGYYISTVQLEDGSTVAFDRRKTNANQVQQAAASGSLWKLTGDKPPAEVQQQAAQDVKGQERKNVQNQQNVQKSGEQTQAPADRYGEAVKIAQEFGKPSTSLLQRRMKINYAEAARYQDRMVQEGLAERQAGGGVPVMKPRAEMDNTVPQSSAEAGGSGTKEGAKADNDDIALARANLGLKPGEFSPKLLGEAQRIKNERLKAEALPQRQPNPLPRDIAGSKPRYGYRDKNFKLQFEDPRDLAAYTVAQSTKNKAHDRFVDYLSKEFPGETEEDFVRRGQDVRGRIKQLAASSEGGILKVPGKAEERPSAPVSAENGYSIKADEQAPLDFNKGEAPGYVTLNLSKDGSRIGRMDIGANHYAGVDNAVEIKNVRIPPELQRQGHGTVLYNEAAKYAKHHGADYVISDTKREPDSEGMWKSLQRKNPDAVSYDSDTGRWRWDLNAPGLVEKGLTDREANSAIHRMIQRGLIEFVSDSESDGDRFIRTTKGSEALRVAKVDRHGERGSSSVAAMPIPAIIDAATGLVKKGTRWYHGQVDKLLNWAHMGDTRPEIRQYDEDAADLATKLDAAGQYHKAVSEMIANKVTGPLTEQFEKGDNYAERARKNEISRDRMKGFHFMADADNRAWLEKNKPDDFARWSADSKIKEAIDAYKPFEQQLRDAVKQLGGKTIDEDYIKRIMDFATSGIDRTETPKGRTAGAGRDSLISPQVDKSKARKADAQFYWDHGVFDFGPSFEKRWVQVMSKLDEHRLAVHSMSMGTRIAAGEELPEKIFYNGQEFYRPDVAKEIKEVSKRGVSPESKALADTLGVDELPTPKNVKEYAVYQPLARGSRFENAASGLAKSVLASHEEASGTKLRPGDMDALNAQAGNLYRMSQLKYALPKEITKALEDAGREKEVGALAKVINRTIAPLTQFIRQQIVGLAYGIPHMANILRKVVQSHALGALNPMGWADAYKVAFSKELKARGINGTADPAFDRLLRNAAISDAAIPDYKHYIEGNFDKDNWKNTIGNAFRQGGKEGGKVTPGSAALGLGRLAVEPLNRFSEAGHHNLFKPGGIDQRARIWLHDFLKDRFPRMGENEIAHEVNQTFGRYNRASWTDVQRNLAPFMLFPGWDYSSIAYALKHPFKTAMAPAVVVMLANAAVRGLGGQQKRDDKFDASGVHVGKYRIRTNLLTDTSGSHIWGWATRGISAALEGKSRKDVAGEVVRGIPGDIAGVTTGVMNPILSTPFQAASNREAPGSSREIIPQGDLRKRGRVLPNKGAEDLTGFGLERMFPLWERINQGGRGPSLASLGALGGLNITKEEKKRRR